MRRLSVVLALSLALGCASPRPLLYPNGKLESVGREVAEVEIEECMLVAEDAALFSDGERAGELAKDPAERAGSGAAAGAAGGAIRGNAGTGAAIGAATAATWGVARSGLRRLFGRSEPNKFERRFVERCLADRDYVVIGWK